MPERAIINSFYPVLDLFNKKHQGFLASLGAGAIGQILGIIYQFLSVPVLLGLWGKAGYGLWIVVFTIPGYVALLDMGIQTSVGNAVSMHVQKQDWGTAQLIYSGGLFCTLIGCALAMMVAIPVAYWGMGLGPAMTSVELRIAIFLLAGYACLVLLQGTLTIPFRAEGANADGWMWLNVARLAEIAALGGIYWMKGYPVHYAALLFAGRGLSVIGMCWAAQKRYVRFPFRPFLASLGAIRPILPASLSFAAFPIGLGIAQSVQILCLQHAAGLVWLAGYSVARNLARFNLQIVSLVVNSILPTITRLHAQGNMASIRVYFTRMRWAGGVVGGLFISAYFWVAPVIMRYWTGREVEVERGVLVLISLSVAASALWAIDSVFFHATNNSRAIARPFIVAVILSLVGQIAVIDFHSPVFILAISLLSDFFVVISIRGRLYEVLK
jgi:O-antigen/teichoic acid export membrane protein